MRLNGYAIRALGREDGARIHWIVNQPAGVTYMVTTLPPAPSGRSRPPKVRMYPKGELPTKELGRIIQSQQREGYTDRTEPEDLRDDVAIQAAGIHRQPRALIRCRTGPAYRPVRDFALTLCRWNHPRLESDRVLRTLLQELSTRGVESPELAVEPGSFRVLVLSFLERHAREHGSAGLIAPELCEPRELLLPATHDPIFRIWGLTAALEHARHHPVARRALF